MLNDFEKAFRSGLQFAWHFQACALKFVIVIYYAYAQIRTHATGAC